jgi:MFS family permease
MLGYFICYGTVNWGSSLSWRFPVAFQAGIAFFLAVMSYVYLPQSPRWLFYKGRGQEATVVWEKLGVLAAEREKDLEQSARARALSAVGTGVKLGLLGRIRRSIHNSIAMFGRGTRKQIFLGVFMMSMQQMSGIDGVMYVSKPIFTYDATYPTNSNTKQYAPILFNQAGLSSSQATFLASGVSAILLCVSTILAFMFVDRWGRRATTIYGGLLLFACMTLLGVLYATDNVHANYGAGKWVVIITIYVFAISYCMSKSSFSLSTIYFLHNADNICRMGTWCKALRQRNPTRGYTSSSHQSRPERQLRKFEFHVACHTKLTYIDLKLLRRLHHTHPTRPLLVRCLLPLRRLFPTYRWCLCNLHP